ncbi:MAG: 16S rRNA (adenine(1518)-N(6)/adenine(1519)-N(6))-dimethyltransferase RsmA [bacterium]|nr:16S rRNA (adenine(1518)-N(6)/adenine(1519)-N(6))-dimethyltransferase RsmA [bacterium]
MNSTTNLKKSLGQNFLRYDWDAKRIAECWGDLHNLEVLEIGAGDGRLTKHLLKRARRVIAVELDQRWCDKLWRTFEGHPGFVLRNDDITKMDWSLEVSGPFVVFGNLPYHLTSKILFQALDYVRKSTEDQRAPQLLGMVVMLQKEVADRALSKPNSSEYGILSTFLQMFSDLERMFHLAPKAFIPAPKVHSSVIKISFHAPKIKILNWELLNVLIRTAYNQRRKMLRNTLNSIRPPLPPHYDQCGIDLRKRPQELSPEDWIEFCNRLTEKGSWKPKKV